MTILREIGLYSDDRKQVQRKFSSSANCVSSLYTRCLSEFRNERFAKLVIMLHETFPEELWFEVNLEPSPTTLINDQRRRIIEPSVDILTVHYEFDFEAYWAKDKSERKSAAAKIVHRGALDAAQWAGWDKAPFDAAYACVEENNFEFVARIDKPKASPDRAHKAQVEYYFDSDAIYLFVIFFTRSGEQCARELLGQLEPFPMNLVGRRSPLGKFSWVDKSSVRLASKDGKREWRAKLPEQTESEDHGHD